MDVTWIRRTRIAGDTFNGFDVPLGEESERYHLRVLQAGEVVRSVSVSEPAWTYTAADQTADGVVGVFEIKVAQISAVYGPGLYRRVSVAV